MARINGMWKGMSRFNFFRVSIVFATALIASGLYPSTNVLAARNIVLFIGDGMGPDHVKAGRLFRGNLQQPLSFETLPFAGESVTVLPGGGITDSATAATALATGYQHPTTGVISVDSTGAIRETILEQAKARGYATGIITTDTITGATPAAFGAHEQDRSQTAEIGQDYLVGEADPGDMFHNASQPNILMGGGYLASYASQAAGISYQVITDAGDLTSLTGPLSMGLFASGTFTAEYLNPPTSQPTLAQMVTRSVDLLSSSDTPFFLMVEGALIDKISQTQGIGPEVDQLDLAVQAALAWRARTALPEDTLIIVTADHETGGLKVSDIGTIEFTSGAGIHTARNVPIYATWPSSLPGQILDNTEIFFLMEDFLVSGRPPVLEAVALSDVTDSSVRITWTTREPATSDLYNPDTTVIWSDASRVSSHQVPLTGLQPSTTYTITVSSTDLAGNTGSVPLTFTTDSRQDVITLVPAGSYWKFDATGTDLGTAWREPHYDDSVWSSGLAQLGYGDGDETTLVPKTSPVNPCYYFRHTFNVTDPAAFSGLTLRLLRDDGAVVYINGTEVARYSLPAGAISYGTWATTASEYGWDPALTVANLLVAGANVLAVEVHQCNSTSSDLSLDLELKATRSVNPSNPPVADAQEVLLLEDMPTAISLTGSDPDNDPLTFRITTAPAHGTLSGNPPDLTYTPAINYFGSDNFAFVVNDGFQDSQPALVSIVVTGSNEDPPTAPQDLTATSGDRQVTLAWSPSTDPDQIGTVTYSIYRRLATVSAYSGPIIANLTATMWLDQGVQNDVAYVYVVRAIDDTSRYSDSVEVSATPVALDYAAYVVEQPALKIGAVTGDFAATRVSDGAGQILAEASRAGAGNLDATYLLHTAADPSMIVNLTLQAVVTSATWDDPWKVFIWKGSVWEEITTEIRTSGTFTPANPQQYVDAAGDIRVGFTDGDSIRKEQLNSLSVDLLRADINVAPLPTELPTAPSALNAETVSESAIALFWSDNAQNEQTYEVQRSSSSETWQVVAELPANTTAFSDSGLIANTIYSYRVRASNSLGYSDFSDTAWAQTDAVPSLNAPSNLSARALPKQKISLAWADNSTDETGFTIEQSLDGISFAAIGAVASGVVTYNDSKLTAGTVYYYRVTAVRETTTSAPSNVVSAQAK